MNKTEAIIAYIVNYFQCNDALSNLDKVKLIAILWFADREFIYKHYKQLTNLEYSGILRGPMPTNIDKILKNMQEKGIIKSSETSKYGYSQTCFLCLEEPDLNCFSAMEISILDKVIMNLKYKSAKQISQIYDELLNPIEQNEVMLIGSVFLQDIVPKR